MDEDRGKHDEEKFDFTAEGEVRKWIGLDQARVQAIEHARDHTEFYGPDYQGASFVWEVLSAEESDDYYDIRLSFRPSGRFQGRPGVEQFIIDKTGEIRIRQLLDEPTGVSRPRRQRTPLRHRILKPRPSVKAVLVAVIVAALTAAIAVPLLVVGTGGGPPVTVVHWTTGHLTRDGLLKDMAREFNAEGHKIGSGRRIVVEVYDVPSELQGEYLSELLRFGTRRDLHEETDGYVLKNIPDPIIVTPSSAHWLVTLNYEVERDRPEMVRPVVDIDAAEIIVRPVIGIVTYEVMAKCLGWPEKKIGFADIIALRNDPQGWASYPCSKVEWGQRPLLAFTDPTTSSTGRSLHLSLYALAADKSPEDLTIEDINDPKVVAYVKNFQGLIDHYLIGTTVLNTKIYQGPRYGHFFIMPEDNLIHLYEGTEKSYFNGIKTTAPPIEERMVMIYPKEGSMPRNNCACIVQAQWVSEEQVEASQVWIDFIREDEQ